MATVDLSKVLAKIDAIGDSFANREARIGFFPGLRYEDGTPVAYVATIQEFGGTFDHPGGTPYRIREDGMAEFVAKGSAGAESLPVTKPHSITIPPRPFMRPTVKKNQGDWTAQIAGGMKKVLKGQMSTDDVLTAVGRLSAADVQKAIKAGADWPPLAAATLAGRKAKGQGTAPLQATGQLIAAVNFEVGDPS